MKPNADNIEVNGRILQISAGSISLAPVGLLQYGPDLVTLGNVLPLADRIYTVGQHTVVDSLGKAVPAFRDPDRMRTAQTEGPRDATRKTSDPRGRWAKLNDQVLTEIKRRREVAARSFQIERERIAEKMASEGTVNSGAFMGAVVQAAHGTFATFAENATNDLIELVEIRLVVGTRI